MFRKIDQPQISGIKIDLEKFSKSSQEIARFIQKSFDPYSHWEQIRFWKMPQGITNIEGWTLIKILRNSIFDKKESVVKDKNGKTFSWIVIPGMEEFLHQVDMKLGGNLFGKPLDEHAQRRLLTRGIMEEAIASSQLEGADTSRKAAKKMLLEHRKPRTYSEHMIVNNHEAMRMIEETLSKKKLDEEMLMRLHITLTKNTRLEKEAVGRYRRDEDEIIVGDDGSKGEIYHVPPTEKIMRLEIQRFFDYANDALTDEKFVHPVIKAIILHFWFGYLHPFVDGNGRMARAIFYWYLLKEKYWAFSYLPLSKIIKNSPAQYRDAYIYTEQDDNDLTYFIEYNIRKITQAMREFEVYAERKMKENTQMAKIARDNYQLNDRQIQLLRYLYKNPSATTTISIHKKIYEVSRITATKDLNSLARHHFLQGKKSGKIIYYSATENLNKLFT